MIYLLVLLGFLFFAAVAMTINEGFWNNTISLLYLLISGIVGAVAGAPLGVLILEKAGQADENAWYFVFAGMWAAFSLSLLVLKILADQASRTRVRFIPLVDKIGGILMGLMVAVMLTSFAAFTLWHAPIKAGQSDWNKDDRKATFAQAVGPFNFVLQRFLEAESVDGSLY